MVRHVRDVVAKKQSTKTGRQALSKVEPGIFDDWIRDFDRFASLIMRAERIVASEYDEDDDLWTYKFSPEDSRPLGERFDRLAVLEMALQHYARENPRDLGFADARGPFAKGPDLHVKVKRRWVHAEVEVQAVNYVKHGHHADPNFANVEILIVPEQEIASSLRPRLPKEIITIKREPFVAWFEPRRAERRFDRSPGRRGEILGAAYADLSHRIENAAGQTVTCAPCAIRLTFRVEEHEPGFRDPDDRVDLRCPRCKTVLANVKALDATLVRTEPS